jgi:hypothetical protein
MAIQGMVITGDTKRDNAIKTAVLDQAIGQGTTSANLRELKAGYDALKLIQKQANQPAEETPAPAEEAPVEETPAPEEEAPVEETPAQEEEEQKTCISHNVVEDGFNIQHKSGMYPYGIAELLGVPKKYQKEFVKMYKDDNGMDKKGQKYNKHPFIRKEYTFADGTSFTLQDTAVTLQEKINKRNWSNNGTGNWHSVKGREVKKTRDGYKYCDDDPYNKAQGIAGRKLTPDEVEAARKEGRLPEDDD